MKLLFYFLVPCASNQYEQRGYWSGIVTHVDVQKVGVISYITQPTIGAAYSLGRVHIVHVR